MLSLHQLSPDQFGLDFLFDPGSSLFITFLGSSTYSSAMVVDDFKEIIRIIERDVDSTSNDQCILTHFPFDPGAICSL